MQFLLLFSILLLCIALFIGPRLQWKISINPCNIEEEKKNIRHNKIGYYGCGILGIIGILVYSLYTEIVTLSGINF